MCWCGRIKAWRLKPAYTIKKLDIHINQCSQIRFKSQEIQSCNFPSYYVKKKSFISEVIHLMIYFVDSYETDTENTRRDLITDQMDKCLLSPFPLSGFNQCHQKWQPSHSFLSSQSSDWFLQHQGFLDCGLGKQYRTKAPKTLIQNTEIKFKSKSLKFKILDSQF